MPPTKKSRFFWGMVPIYIEEIDIGILASHTSFFLPKWEVHLHSIGLKLVTIYSDYVVLGVRVLGGGFTFLAFSIHLLVLAINIIRLFSVKALLSIVDELTFCWLYIVITSTSPTVGETCPVLLLSGSFKAGRDGRGVWGGVGPHGRPS